jgi:hypothetical protein
VGKPCIHHDAAGSTELAKFWTVLSAAARVLPNRCASAMIGFGPIREIGHAKTGAQNLAIAPLG